MQQFNMKQKEECKETELGFMPKSWKIKNFEECINKEKTKVGKINKQEFKNFGKHPIIDQGQSLIAGYWDKEDDVYQGDLPVIIFGDHTRILKYIEFPFVCGADGTKVIVSNLDVVNPKFFYYALKSIEIPSRGYNRHYSLLKEKKIACPPITEQKKISYVLSTIQEAKEKTEKVINSLKELKKSMTDHFFTYGPINLKEAGKIELKETDNVRFSSNWKFKPLAECVDNIEYGHSISIPANINPKGIYIISTADITKDGRLLYSKVRKINPPKKIADRLLLRQGDILFNWRNSPELVGKTTIFQEGILNLPVIYASFVLRIRTDEKKSHNAYFKYLLNYYREKGIFIKLARRAVNQANYNRNEINKLMVPFPEFQIQKQIAFLLTKIDEKIAFEENKKKALEELFKSMLYNLMSAKIRVNHLEI